MRLKFNIYFKTLGLFSLLSLLPLIVLGLMSYHNARQSLEKNIGYKLEELARLAMERVDHQLTQYSQQIQGWANLEVMQDVLTFDADGRINTALVNLKKNYPVYHQISCLNQKGEIIASSEPELVGKLSEKIECPPQGTAHKVRISKVCRLKHKNEIGITFSIHLQAIGTQERAIGSLFAILDGEALYPLLENIKIESTLERQLKSAHIMVIDPDGLVIFAPEWERQALNNILKQAIFTEGIPGADNKNTTGYTIQLDEHNQLSLIGYARSSGHGDYPGMGWTTLALQNLDKAFAPVFRLRNFILISATLLALAAILIANLFARQLTVPIKSLTQATRRIAQKVKGTSSEFSESIQVKTTDEVGELADAFNLMSGELGLAKRELEEKNKSLEENNTDLEYTIKEVQKLLEDAVEKQSFKVRFKNPELGKCWEVSNCNNTKCPAYKNEDRRCWHTAGTFCKGEVQGAFAQKLGTCKKCEVYQQAVSTKFYAIGEVFNNMMAMLEGKNEEIKDYTHNLEKKVQERTSKLESEITERKQAETEREKYLHEMKERIKELKCIYGVAKSIRERKTLNEIFQDVADIISSGWQYQEITCARVCFKGKAYVSKEFKKTKWRQTSNIIVGGEQQGTVEVYYLEGRPISDEGPFLKEERYLIDGIAQALSEAIEHKQAEETLTESEEKYRRLMETANDAIFTADVETGKFIEVNKKAEELLGRPANEIIGMHETQMHAPEDAEYNYKRFQEAIRKRKSITTDISVAHKDGHKIPVEISSSVTTMGGKKVITGIFRDVTERKRKEEEIKKNAEMLQRANQELKQAQQQIVQAGKMAAIGQLAAGVSHELNNPLGGILGYSQFVLQMRKGKDSKDIAPDRLEKIFTYVGYIERESQRCKTIVSNLLKFSRSSKTDIVPLDINRVLEETVIFTQHQLDINHVELVQELAPNLSRVMGNEHQLQQVFTNLIVNAQQSMKGGGKLKISTAPNNGTVEIVFADTGCGIPKKHIDKLFDPFFTTKEVGEGTGLGLSVSYGIIRDLKGDIEVESQVRKGTTFHIKLPVEKDNKKTAHMEGKSHVGPRRK